MAPNYSNKSKPSNPAVKDATTQLQAKAKNIYQARPSSCENSEQASTLFSVSH